MTKNDNQNKVLMNQLSVLHFLMRSIYITWSYMLMTLLTQNLDIDFAPYEPLQKKRNQAKVD